MGATVTLGIPASMLNEARGWLADCGIGGAYAGTQEQVSAAVEREYDGGVAAFITACTATPAGWPGNERTIPARPTLRLSTPELQVGDVIGSHGMRILLEQPAKVYERGTGRECWSWIGTVLNPEESIRDYGIPRGFLGEHQWEDGQGWVFVQTNRWNVQGNHLARWTVLYRPDEQPEHEPGHMTSLVPDDRYEHLRGAVCSCGWRSSGFAAEPVARMWANNHVGDPSRADHYVGR